MYVHAMYARFGLSILGIVVPFFPAERTAVPIPE